MKDFIKKGQYSDTTTDIVNAIYHYLNDETKTWKDIYSFQLHALAGTIDLYDQACAELKKYGIIREHINAANNLVIIQNPAVMIRDRAYKQITSICDQFGLSLKAQKVFKNVQEDEDSPLLDFLNDNEG